MKEWATYAAASLATIAAIGVLLGLTAFRTPADHRALLIAGSVAWGVQLLTFAVVRFAGRRQVMKAWAAGVTLRFATLALFAFVALRVLALPATPALIGLAAFLFVSTLLETRFLSS